MGQRQPFPLDYITLRARSLMLMYACMHGRCITPRASCKSLGRSRGLRMGHGQPFPLDHIHAV